MVYVIQKSIYYLQVKAKNVKTVLFLWKVFRLLKWAKSDLPPLTMQPSIQLSLGWGHPIGGTQMTLHIDCHQLFLEGFFSFGLEALLKTPDSKPGPICKQKYEIRRQTYIKAAPFSSIYK